MDKKRLTWVVVGGALVLALIVVAILYFSAGHDDRAQVSLPDVAEQEQHAADDGSSVQLVQIDVTNVRNVIGMLEREQEYTMTLKVSNLWSGGSSEVTHRIFCGSKMTLITSSYSSGSVKNTVIKDGWVYIWYQGENTKKKVPVGDFQLEDQLGVYTYEDVLDTGSGEITDAGYTMLGEKNCVFVEIKSGEYVTRCWIEEAGGQLIQMERYSDGQLVISATVTEYSSGIEDESVFDIRLD